MTLSKADLLTMTDEYVMGLLDDEATARIDAALEIDDDVIAAVAASRARFLDLDTALDPQPLPPGFWDRVAAALPDRSPRQSEAAGRRAPGAPATAVARPGWRMILTGAIAASIGLAIGVAGSLWRLAPSPQLAPPPQVAVIAVLQSADGTPIALIEDYGDDTARVSFLAEPDVPEGLSMQVWTKPSEEIGPVSLGVLDDSRPRVLSGPDLPAPVAMQLYEITLEQEGGSPTGLPTGPILGLGLASAPMR